MIEQREHRGLKLRLCTWNINAIRNKLDKGEVQSFISEADIICLNEIKTQMKFSIPGFVTYQNAQDAHRGGVAILVKNSINRFLSHVDLSVKDRISWRLKCLPNITFISCYIPPYDSPYFDLNYIASLSSTLKTNPEGSYVVLGDMNCKYGYLVDRFLDGMLSSWSYNANVTPPNQNAKHAIDVMQPLVLLNGLDTGRERFSDEPTYRQGKDWKSMLDHVYVSRSLVDYVENFYVANDITLPSDHAPVFFSLSAETSAVGIDWNELKIRSSQLAQHELPSKPGYVCHKQLRWSNTDKTMLERLVSDIPPPLVGSDAEDCAVSLDSTVRNMCLRAQLSQGRVRDGPIQDWNTLLEKQDAKAIWQAIDWSGSINDGSDRALNEKPSDEKFKTHFESLLNPDGEPPPMPAGTGTYMPVTDDPIQPREVHDAIQTIKPDKSGGPSGITPGVLKLLPVSWIVFLAQLFTTVFYSARIPNRWGLSRLIVLFKKGDKTDCNNYRGISVTDTFAKLYDIILARRLETWMKPSREQAGGQRGRGCTEQILSLRLLFDYAISRKKKLFITYIDFSKAYDKVPRRALINYVLSLGCGASMVMAIAARYGDTRMALGSAVIATSIGLLQGLPTSIWLFTAYIDKFVRMLKLQCQDDGFLGWLHCLILMDDTIVLATSRDRLREKMEILMDFCRQSGMVINQKKTNLMVVNGNQEDREPMIFPELTVMNCEAYTYLGAIFTQDGRASSSVESHIISKKSNVMKFVAFMSKNCDFPFIVKKQVLESALLSSIFYGCEAWTNHSARLIEVTYRSLVKTLLGVRTTTANDLCLMEMDYSSAEARVREVQRKFLIKILTQRNSMVDDPFIHIWNICKSENTRAYQYFDSVMRGNDHILADKVARVEKIRNSTNRKSVLYCELNPSFTMSRIYEDKNVSEHERIVATRLRLSAHNLAVEKGRWSRTPLEDCKCKCGQVQTVEHILCFCPNTAHIRGKFQNCAFESSEKFWASVSPHDMCKIAFLSNEAVEP